jgi:DNA-binding LytR/AlgR family response regulator
MKRIYLVEDEPLAFKRLSKLILELEPNWEIVGHADSVESAVDFLKKMPSPDLIFMDIQLADGISFSIFESVEIKAPVIFTTAYDEYALKAFKVNSIDYLLKPIDADELKASITKFKQRSSSQFPDISSIIQEINSNKNYRSRFLLTKGDSLIPIETSDIAWIIAEDKLVFLIQNSGNKSLFPFTLDELTTQLNPIDFFRINRSVIAHRNSIQKAELHFNGKIKIHLNPSTESEQFVSREKAASFKDWWGS